MKSKAEWRGILSNYSCCNCIAIDVFGTIMITTFSNKKNAENCRKHHRYRKGRSQMFFKKDVLKNFSIFTGKHLCWSLLLNKWQVFRSAALLKKRLQHSCFPVNIAKFLRTAFLQNISGGRLYIITFNTLQSRKSVAVSMFPIFYQFIKFI